MNRILLSLLVVAIIATLVSSLASAQTPSETAAEFAVPAQEAIDQGLAYLVKNQNEDGSFAGGYGRNVAVVGLSGMAFLASGSSPGRGPHGDAIDRCIDYLLEHAQPSGFITAPGATSQGPMYGHGFATLFLAETHGMSLRDDLHDKLSAAVKLIVSTQNDEGGWRYQPRPADADLSVTICQIMALRAARNAGLHVPGDTVDRCIGYVRRCQNPDGGFSYTLTNRTSLFPRSAAGVVALYNAGVYEGKELDRGLDYLEKHLPSGQQRRTGHYFYGQYYAVQAMWQAGGQRWNAWYPAIRGNLLTSQQTDGSWRDSISPIYATAMACIILQTPNDIVPIFQR